MTPMTKHAVLAGALDTKGQEYAFVRDRLAAHGVAAVLIDTGILGRPGIRPDIDRAAVASAAGERIERLAEAGDRAAAVAAMAHGAARIIAGLCAQGAADGVMVLGGSNAGAVMAEIARALPFGFPKLLVSTVVAGDTRPYVGASDLMMMYPVVDIAGLNSVSIPVLAHAADALAGLITGPPVPAAAHRGATVACSMFGVTTECVTSVSTGLEAEDDEVQVFHATGTGGRSMEAMIRSNAFDAVADITTTELADHLVGGVCDAGPDRLEAAGATGTPQVVSTGALDMVNFGPRRTVPERFRGRLMHEHNAAVTLMRTTVDENAALGRTIARKLNTARGPVEVLVPSLGFSQISVAGGPFHDPDADAALIDALTGALDPRIPLHVVAAAINDPAFAAEVLRGLDRVRELRKGSDT